MEQKAYKIVDKYSLFNPPIEDNMKGIYYRASAKNSVFPYLVLYATKEKLKKDPNIFNGIKNETKLYKEMAKNNENVLQFIEMIETPTSYYYIFENSKDCSIINHIKSSRSDEQETFWYFIQVLDGYREFYNRKLVHSNINSSTILKFGKMTKISPVYIEIHENQKYFSYYDAPEILNGKKATMKSDIWSFGILIYELLYGKPDIEKPYKKEDIEKVHRNILKTVQTPSRIISISISQECNSLLLKMLQVEDFKRPSWEEIFQEPFLLKHKGIIEDYLIDNFKRILIDYKQGRLIIEDFDPKYIKTLTPDLKTLMNPKNFKLFISMATNFSIILQIYKSLLNCLDCYINNPYYRKKSFEDDSLNSAELDQKLKTFDETNEEESNNVFKRAITMDIHASPEKKTLNSSNSIKNLNSSNNNSPDKRYANSYTNSPDKKTNNSLSSSPEKKQSTFNFEKNSPEKSDRKFKEERKISMDEPQIINVLKMANKNDKIDMTKGLYFKNNDQKDKEERMTTVIEMSNEINSILTNKFALKMNNVDFEEVTKDFIFRYLHEKEICEFIDFIISELKNYLPGVDLTIYVYFISKFLLIRMNLLKIAMESKKNIFNLDYWLEITNSNVYNLLCDAIFEHLNLFESNFKEIYKKAFSFNVIDKDQKKFINDNCKFKEENLNKMIIQILSSFALNIEAKAKKTLEVDKIVNNGFYKGLYLILYLINMVRILNIDNYDIELEFEINDVVDNLPIVAILDLQRNIEILKKKIKI